MRVGNLRKYSIAGALAILLMGILASVAALQGWWALTVIVTHVSLVITVLIILVLIRYVTSLIRTEGRKSRVTVEHLAHGLSQDAANIVRRQTESHGELQTQQQTIHETLAGGHEALVDVHEALTGVHEALGEIKEAASASGSAVQHQVVELEAALQRAVKSNSSHVTSTVRDSTRQVESLAQIYSRFSNMKLPMPSTGGFAIDAQALGHLITLVEERSPRRILELGSGTSTVWLGYLARSFDGTVVTLDHLEGYLELTRTAIDRHALNDCVESRLAPLEEVESDGQTYQWYSPDALRDLADIDLVLIDGPPAATGPQARYPALPQIISMLAPHATVILDDAHRQEESDIVDLWQSKYPDFKQIEIGTSRLAVLERKS